MFEPRRRERVNPNGSLRLETPMTSQERYEIQRPPSYPGVIYTGYLNPGRMIQPVEYADDMTNRPPRNDPKRNGGNSAQQSPPLKIRKGLHPMERFRLLWYMPEAYSDVNLWQRVVDLFQLLAPLGYNRCPDYHPRAPTADVNRRMRNFRDALLLSNPEQRRYNDTTKNPISDLVILWHCPEACDVVDTWEALLSIVQFVTPIMDEEKHEYKAKIGIYTNETKLNERFSKFKRLLEKFPYTPTPIVQGNLLLACVIQIFCIFIAKL